MVIFSHFKFTYMLTFPSLQSLLNSALYTLKRFPIVLLCALIGTFVSCYLSGLRHSQDETVVIQLTHLLIVTSLGLTLFLSIALYTESNKKTSVFKIVANALGLVVLTIYYFCLPNRFEQIEVYRYILFNIGLHLLVSFSPFINQGTINGFWQFNKVFFLRILISVLYTGVLYLGLAIALFAIDQLFHATISGEFYLRLWIVLVGIFNTWFFLDGVPKELHQLNEENSYPKGLKIFTQFVLLPLVSIYLLILYAYLIKITFNWELPKGWVSYLVISFSVVGILSLLLIYPIRNNEGNNWINIFSRWFYRALYPLIFLLFIAIYKRVSEYGITENRYYILVLALWLAAIAAYFLLSAVKNIKVIPISLCLIAFLSSFGPLSSFSISKRSQLNRLEKLLTENKILVDGNITKKHLKIDYKENARISSILKYLDKTHELYVLQPWFKEPMDSIFKSKNENYVDKLNLVHTSMGIEFVYDRYGYDEAKANDEPFYYYSNNNNYDGCKKVKGFDYVVNFNFYNYFPKQSFVLETNDSLHLKLDTIQNSIIVIHNAQQLLELHLADIFKRAESTERNSADYLTSSEMTIESDNKQAHAKLELNNLGGKIVKSKKIVTSVYGVLYFSLKDSLNQK